MALPLDAPAFKDALVVLGAAGLVIPAFHALRISPVVGFILVGVIVGPHGLGMLAGLWPPLGLVAISDASTLAPIAEIGVAMLLFMLGLELSLERLKTMRSAIFGIGSAQLAACTALLALCLMPFGVGLAATLAIAAALALSSTAVGLQLLSQSGRLASQAGRAAIGILLLQDLALAPMLAAQAAVEDGVVAVLLRAALAVAAVLLVGRLALRPLFAQAARTRSPELFLAASLVVVMGAAAITAAAGLSPVIGALLAGLVLAETEYRRQIEAAIEPLQGLGLGVFLIWVGMTLDLGAVATEPAVVLGAVAAVCAVKATTIFAILRLAGRSNGVAGHVGLLLAAPSETSLVVLASAAAAGLLAGPVAALATVVAALGLAAAPLLGLAGRLLEPRLAGAPEPAPAPAPEERRTVIIGFGRVGRMVSDMLSRHERPWIAVDADPDAVAGYRRAGLPVIYGDARRPELLRRLDLERAAAVVVTLDQPGMVERLVPLIRAGHPDLRIIARARDAAQAATLYRLGASDAVPEAVEASLQLSEAVLVDLGVPMGPVIASIHEKRAELRSAIMDAAPGLDREPPLRRRRLRDLRG